MIQPDLPTDSSLSARTHVQLRKKVHAYWNKWSTHYLDRVRDQQLGTVSSLISVGDRIVYKDRKVDKEGVWPTGTVHKVYPGEDGLVRLVDVAFDDGTVVTRRAVRHIVRLATLPPEDDSNPLDLWIILSPDVATCLLWFLGTADSEPLFVCFFSSSVRAPACRLLTQCRPWQVRRSGCLAIMFCLDLPWFIFSSTFFSSFCSRLMIRSDRAIFCLFQSSRNSVLFSILSSLISIFSLISISHSTPELSLDWSQLWASSPVCILVLPYLVSFLFDLSSSHLSFPNFLFPRANYDCFLCLCLFPWICMARLGLWPSDAIRQPTICLAFSRSHFLLWISLCWSRGSSLL